LLHQNLHIGKPGFRRWCVYSFSPDFARDKKSEAKVLAMRTLSQIKHYISTTSGKYYLAKFR